MDLKKRLKLAVDYIYVGVENGEDIGKMIIGLQGVIVCAFLGGFICSVKEIVDEVFL